MILPADFIAKLGKSIPKIETLPILQHAALTACGNDQASFVTTDLETATDHMTRTIDGEFPEYEKLIPTGEPTARVCLSSDFILQAAKFLKDFYKDYRGLKAVDISSYENNGPLLLAAETSEHSARVLIMPIRK